MNGEFWIKAGGIKHRSMGSVYKRDATDLKVKRVLEILKEGKTVTQCCSSGGNRSWRVSRTCLLTPVPKPCKPAMRRRFRYGRGCAEFTLHALCQEWNTVRLTATQAFVCARFSAGLIRRAPAAPMPYQITNLNLCIGYSRALSIEPHHSCSVRTTSPPRPRRHRSERDSVRSQPRSYGWMNQ